MGFEFGGAALLLAVSLAISNWFHWSLRPQPIQTYEVAPLLATRFPFPGSCALVDNGALTTIAAG